MCCYGRTTLCSQTFAAMKPRRSYRSSSRRLECRPRRRHTSATLIPTHTWDLRYLQYGNPVPSTNHFEIDDGLSQPASAHLFQGGPCFVRWLSSKLYVWFGQGNTTGERAMNLGVGMHGNQRTYFVGNLCDTGRQHKHPEQVAQDGRYCPVSSCCPVLSSVAQSVRCRGGILKSTVLVLLPLPPCWPIPTMTFP